jgi:hypothetical protein
VSKQRTAPPPAPGGRLAAAVWVASAAAGAAGAELPAGGAGVVDGVVEVVGVVEAVDVVDVPELLPEAPLPEAGAGVAGAGAGAGAAAAEAAAALASRVIERKSVPDRRAAFWSWTSSEGTSSSAGTALPRRAIVA